MGFSSNFAILVFAFKKIIGIEPSDSVIQAILNMKTKHMKNFPLGVISLLFLQ